MQNAISALSIREKITCAVYCQIAGPTKFINNHLWHWNEKRQHQHFVQCFGGVRTKIYNRVGVVRRLMLMDDGKKIGRPTTNDSNRSKNAGKNIYISFVNTKKKCLTTYRLSAPTKCQTRYRSAHVLVIISQIVLVPSHCSHRSIRTLATGGMSDRRTLTAYGAFATSKFYDFDGRQVGR